eukprot:CAMPEP_0197845766 /NCGR_PEP_ID=MMETSP1438-20131217/2653_1 /TAXON_ID=1461541 /ORGANISM="Pterosperma sp., Strain CCMP1384" /LENGTH=212 /DNA_ID=CAMNT_0043457189 /DNA_START=127 /DNA_END=765 /DNA_ORIENTATION=+
MLRQASRVLLNRAAGVSRPFTVSALRCSEEVKLHETETFSQKWASVNPEYLTVPKFGKDYLSEAPADHEVGAPLPNKLKFNFFMPHSVEMNEEEVDMVLVPGAAGDFGILPGHVPTVAQLRPGVMTVHKGDGDENIQKYFVSSGFAFIHANSTAEVCAVEAVPLEQLDPQSVAQSLEEYTKLLTSADDDYAKAQAQIGIEVCSAMNSALEGK